MSIKFIFVSSLKPIHTVAMTLDPDEAKLHYGDNDLKIIKPGTFVRCATTGEKILLDALKYWSIEKQELYKNAAAAVARMCAKSST